MKCQYCGKSLSCQSQLDYHVDSMTCRNLIAHVLIAVVFFLPNGIVNISGDQDVFETKILKLQLKIEALTGIEKTESYGDSTSAKS